MGTKSKENKLSQFEIEAKKLLTEDENVDVQTERAYRKAVSKINTQISQLEGKRVDYQDKIDDANDDVKKAKFSLNFDLSKYDSSVERLETLEAELAAIESTMKNRKELLSSWK